MRQIAPTSQFLAPIHRRPDVVALVIEDHVLNVAIIQEPTLD